MVILASEREKVFIIHKYFYTTDCHLSRVPFRKSSQLILLGLYNEDIVKLILFILLFNDTGLL
jgi:hypothetical protein